MKNWNKKCNQKDNGFDCSTSSFHNSTNTGPICMFFTKKCNYFSQATRWNHSILSQSQLKWCFGTLNLYFYQKENWLFQTQLLNIIQIAKTLLLLGLRQKWMIPSCCPWKVVTFFGKDHVNWSSINGVMKGWSQKIKFGKLKIGVNKKNIRFFKLDFSTSSYHIYSNIGPNGMFFTKN